MLFEIAIAIAICFLIWRILKADDRMVELASKIPGPPLVPILGNFFNFPISGPECITVIGKLVKELGPTLRCWFANRLIVVITDPDDIQTILSSNTLTTKAETYFILYNWLKTGLLTSNGEKWHMRRKAITPTFHFKILETFSDIFDKNSKILVNLLKEKARKGENFNIYPYFTNCTLDTICETAMGVDVKAQSADTTDYVKAIRKLMVQLAKRMSLQPWLNSDIVYSLFGYQNVENSYLKVLNGLTDKVIGEASTNYDAKSKVPEISEDDLAAGIKKKKAFLEMLIDLKMKNDPAFQSIEDIREEVATFMFEGHDTTSSALSFTTWLLGKHPEIQQKAYEEQLRIIGAEDRYVKHEELQEMKYLEMVIKDALRLCPSVPFIGRQITQETVLPSGYTLPVDTIAIINIYFAHRSTQHYEKPDEFNPHNFLPEIASKRHPYSYVPFSAGPRNCIGQKFAMNELKSMVSSVIRNFEIESCNDVIPDSSLILQSTNGFQVKLKLRNK